MDSILHTITVVAVCQPYKLWQTPTRVDANLTTTATKLLLTNGRMLVVPTLVVTASTTLIWNGNTFTISAGTHKLLDIQLVEGVNVLEAKTTAGTGKISVEYRKGAL